MAVVFTAARQIDRIVTDAAAGNVTKVTFHANTRTVTIEGYDAAGTTATACKVAYAGTDGAAIGADFYTIDAGAKLEIPVAGHARERDGAVLYIASTVNSGIVEVEASPIQSL